MIGQMEERPGEGRHPYDALTPDLLLDAVESVGYRASGRLLALNSYENRVYQVELEAGGYLVAKFYRPGRWSDEAILEEHAFSLALAEAEIPVVAPLRREGESLFRHAGFRFALFPRVGGRWPDLEREEDLRWMGRYLGRIHAVAAGGAFRHRPHLSPQRLGRESVGWLLESGFIPTELREAWGTLAEALMEVVESRWAMVEPEGLRLLGDCHRGNILWSGEGPRFVDLDDAATGPAVQDLWMLLDGDRPAMQRQLGIILDEYTLFHDFDPRQLSLIEPLRTLRMIHYSAWLARRWDDPAFPRSFPWFGESRYWEEQILALREQQDRLLNEPPLIW